MHCTTCVLVPADLLMIKRITQALIVAGVCICIAQIGKAQQEVEFIPMKATAYCINGTTATETHTRPGICAGPREHFYDVAMVYKRNKDGSLGEFIGYFECLDTGGKAIKSGKVLDIWLPTYEECRQFGSKDIYVVWRKGKG